MALGSGVLPCHLHSFLSSSNSNRTHFHTRTVSYTKFTRCVVIRAQQKTKATNVQEEEALALKECLHNLSLSTGVHYTKPSQHFTLKGGQHMLGLDGDWVFSWCMDGRFYEKFDSQDITFECGYDGNNGHWHVDHTGRVTAVELDDDEVTQLCVYLRTGFWLTEKGQNLLNIQFEGEGNFDAIKKKTGEIKFAICLKNKKIVAHLHVDACQWLPLSMELKVLGQTERWEYKDWRTIDDCLKHRYPYLCVRYPGAGGKDTFTLAYSLLHNGVEDTVGNTIDRGLPYRYPDTLLVPRHNQFYPRVSIDAACPSAVKMLRAKGGQLLVKPHVDGSDIGYFILDTGAGGLAISPSLADKLKMGAFGEVFVSGFHGHKKSHYRRGNSFQLGPLKIESPLFVEVDTASLNIGPHPIVGVCGFDVFQQGIVKLSCREESISIFDSKEFERDSEYSLEWEKLAFIQNVPNIAAKINGQNALLLFDTGASGVDVIFHSESDIYTNTQLERSTNIRGINSQGLRQQVSDMVINRVEIANHVFKNVHAICLSSETKLPLSEYTSGILCMDMIENFVIIIDYPNRRIALVDNRNTDM